MYVYISNCCKAYFVRVFECVFISFTMPQEHQIFHNAFFIITMQTTAILTETTSSGTCIWCIHTRTSMTLTVLGLLLIHMTAFLDDNKLWSEVVHILCSLLKFTVILDLITQKFIGIHSKNLITTVKIILTLKNNPFHNTVYNAIK